ncbi:MAG: hypothetical protein J2P17_25590, partial [Mycobacterium sp.]|nr:hypothetical protein [Mycobacterium sp.]
RSDPALRSPQRQAETGKRASRTGAPDCRAGGTGASRRERSPDCNRSRQGAVEHQRADVGGFQP